MSLRTDTPKIIVGLPAYNEEVHIGTVILQARQYAGEVIVADDGSHDRTAKIAELAGARVIRHQVNGGYGSAIKTLLDEGRQRDVDILVIIDADGQHDPDQIPLFIKSILDGNDMAIGSRKADSNNIPAYRRVGQNILSSSTRILSGSNISDTECGFRAYSRKALSLIQPKENGMAISAEIVSEATAKGLKVAEIPVSAIYIGDGSTLHPIKHGVTNLQRITIMISERRPLLFFGVAGVIMSLVGVAAGINVAKNYYLETPVLQTGTALLSMLFITVGMLSIFTGLILDVIVRRLNR